MRKNLYRENEIIEQTRQVIQSFYGRKTESTIAPMSEDFMWIGSNDFQWCEGIDEFIQVTKRNTRKNLYSCQMRNTICCSMREMYGLSMAAIK